MSDAASELIESLRRCLVWIGTVDASGGGSGVWIAPDLVLTCAHVVAGKKQLRVTWDEQQCEARIGEAVPSTNPDFGFWPYPDLAVLEVKDAPAHPCAWLSDRPISFKADFLGLGRAAIYGDTIGLNSARGRHGGPAGLGGFDSDFIRFIGDELAPGMSGGPVLDMESGAVCGLIKATRREASDLGGLVIPLDGIRHLSENWRARMWRAHDIAHSDGTWAVMRERLVKSRTDEFGDPKLSPRDEAELLGLLTEIQPGASLVEVFSRTQYDRSTQLRRTPLALRDLMYELADSWRNGELYGPVRLAVNACEWTAGKTRDGLFEWSVRVAAELQQRDLLGEWRTRTVPREEVEPVIIVQIESGAREPEKYRVMAWTHQGSHVANVYAENKASHDIHDVRVVVAQLIAAELTRLRGKASIEMVLPSELLAVDFDEIAIGPYSKLGRTNPVVVRSLDRLNTMETWSAWKQRWRDFHSGSADLMWLECDDDVNPDIFDGRVRADGKMGALGLTRQLDATMREALEVAIYAGIPIAIWRRDGCEADHDDEKESACAGECFKQALQRARAETVGVPLPALIQKLRSAAAAPEGTDFRNIVLLWDNPERLPEPFAPLMQP